jgi:hypothetical protein
VLTVPVANEPGSREVGNALNAGFQFDSGRLLNAHCSKVTTVLPFEICVTASDASSSVMGSPLQGMMIGAEVEPLSPKHYLDHLQFLVKCL